VTGQALEPGRGPVTGQGPGAPQAATRPAISISATAISNPFFFTIYLLKDIPAWLAPNFSEGDHLLLADRGSKDRSVRLDFEVESFSAHYL
jgi:hypothetical protein